jgi:hypothetical protein
MDKEKPGIYTQILYYSVRKKTEIILFSRKWMKTKDHVEQNKADSERKILFFSYVEFRPKKKRKMI